MSSKIDKEMLKNPDVFVSTSDHIFNYIERHFKTVAAVVAVAVLGGTGYVGVGYMNARTELKAAEALYVPEAALRKVEASFSEAKALTPDSKKPAVPVKTEDFATDYAPSVEQIKTVIKANAQTRAALVSALSLSSFLLQQKQYSASLEVLQLVKFDVPISDIMGGFWYMQRGVVLMENGQTDPAIEAYDKILKSDALKAFHPEALLKLGVCREMKGDAAKAREAYERVGREFPETEAAQNAQQYLRLMQMKTPQQG